MGVVKISDLNNIHFFYFRLFLLATKTKNCYIIYAQDLIPREIFRIGLIMSKEMTLFDPRTHA